MNGLDWVSVVSAVASVIGAGETFYRFLIHDPPDRKGMIKRSGVFACCLGIVVIFWPGSYSESPADHYREAQQLFAENNRPRAIEEAKRAIALEPTHRGAWKLLGACYGTDGDMPLAAEAYKRATQIDPEDSEAYLGLARALIAEGDRKQAGAVYHLVLRNRKSTAEQIGQARDRLRKLCE